MAKPVDDDGLLDAAIREITKNEIRAVLKTYSNISGLKRAYVEMTKTKRGTKEFEDAQSKFKDEWDKMKGTMPVKSIRNGGRRTQRKRPAKRTRRMTKRHRAK
jgi:hypothetical protein